MQNAFACLEGLYQKTDTCQADRPYENLKSVYVLSKKRSLYISCSGPFVAIITYINTSERSSWSSPDTCCTTTRTCMWTSPGSSLRTMSQRRILTVIVSNKSQVGDMGHIEIGNNLSRKSRQYLTPSKKGTSSEVPFPITHIRFPHPPVSCS